MESENVTLTAVTEDKTKIVGAFPQIIVTGTADNPYYEIMYYEFADGEIHVGYSSYDLDCVFWFLEEYFGETRARIVDPESLRPKGRWEKHMEFDFKACRDFQAGFRCSCCGVWKLNIDNLKYCPNCGAKMEG